MTTPREAHKCLCTSSFLCRHLATSQSQASPPSPIDASQPSPARHPERTKQPFFRTPLQRALARSQPLARTPRSAQGASYEAPWQRKYSTPLAPVLLDGPAEAELGCVAPSPPLWRSSLESANSIPVKSSRARLGPLSSHVMET